ncbi:MAG: hypothetical protein LBL66_09850 [Clostridiales bacterium]|jgi:hypothetical protein|nr:hypothetical protein [Clostridiales bacterium]
MKKRTRQYFCWLWIAAALATLSLAAGTARADGWESGEPAPEEPKEITYVLDECDTTDNFLALHAVDRSNYITGGGSVYHQGSVPAVSALFRNLDRSKLPPLADAYLEMYFWIEDADKIQEGQIELNSTGANDIYEIMFVISRTTIELDSGWNYVSLKLSEANESDPSRKFDYANLMGMRVYTVSKSGTVNAIRLDHIILTDTPKLAAVKEAGIHPQSASYTVIDLVVDESVANRGTAGYWIWLAGAAAATAGFGAAAAILFLKGRKKV